MATEVIMPKQGNTVETCVIVDWKKSRGDQIEQGDLICEIETDKALMEVESPASGVVLELLFQAGEEVPVLSVIALIGDEGEEIYDRHSQYEDAVGNEGVRKSNPDTYATLETSDDDSRNGSMIQSDSESNSDLGTQEYEDQVDTHDGDEYGILHGIKISPRAGKLLAQNNMDISEISGTGPEGRIIERDIQEALDRKSSSVISNQREMNVQSPTSYPANRDHDREGPGHDDVNSSEVTKIPLSGIRKVIAERMSGSLRNTAQTTLNSSALADSLQSVRKRLNSASETKSESACVTINDLIMYAVSRTLRQLPALNATYSEGEIIQYENVHLGYAVDTQRGLLGPVIRNADTLTLAQISSKAQEMTTACGDGSIQTEDMSNGTFTVSNLGALGIESFAPILNPPQVGILGVGSINPKAMMIDGEVQFKSSIGLSLTIDHQIIDGATGARFLQKLSVNIGNIDNILDE